MNHLSGVKKMKSIKLWLNEIWWEVQYMYDLALGVSIPYTLASYQELCENLLHLYQYFLVVDKYGRKPWKQNVCFPKK